jgi:transcriptional regulator with XRE-family HTH domain
MSRAHASAGNTLAAAIHARGQSVTEAAARLGCSQSLLSLVASGKRTASAELAARLLSDYGWRTSR